MSSSEPQNQQDKSLVSVRPILQTVGRGGSIAGDGRGGVAGSGYENTLPSQLSAANSVSLRPQLVTCLPTALTASTPDRSDSCPGPVQQLLPQQHLQSSSCPETTRQEELARLTKDKLKYGSKKRMTPCPEMK